jgi:very-short-patch-repair endonuclease
VRFSPKDLYEKIKPLARQMRSDPTPAENYLWQRLRREQVMGYKFRRQHPIERFIVDFYCPQAWLVIEVDGDIHEMQQEADALRQAYLESLGLRVLRFRNEEVLRHIDAVIERIGEVLLEWEEIAEKQTPAAGLGGEDGGEQTPPLGLGGEDGGEQTPPLGLDGEDGGEQTPPLAPPHRDGEGKGEGFNKMRVITKWDIFYYVYGLLHHPVYRTRYAANLKRELPRIPFAPDFWGFAEAGRKLADLHLGYESVEPYPLEYEWKAGKPVQWRVEKMRLDKTRTAIQVNESLTLRGIPAEAFEYRLGNRSAVEWVIDQYQVRRDDHGVVVSDPNRYSDNERYIVELVGRVIRVSVETAAIVRGLPALGIGGEALTLNPSP